MHLELYDWLIPCFSALATILGLLFQTSDTKNGKRRLKQLRWFLIPLAIVLAILAILEKSNSNQNENNFKANQSLKLTKLVKCDSIIKVRDSTALVRDSINSHVVDSLKNTIIALSGTIKDLQNSTDKLDKDMVNVALQQLAADAKSKRETNEIRISNMRTELKQNLEFANQMTDEMIEGYRKSNNTFSRKYRSAFIEDGLELRFNKSEKELILKVVQVIENSNSYISAVQKHTKAGKAKDTNFNSLKGARDVLKSLMIKLEKALDKVEKEHYN